LSFRYRPNQSSDSQTTLVHGFARIVAASFERHERESRRDTVALQRGGVAFALHREGPLIVVGGAVDKGKRRLDLVGKELARGDLVGPHLAPGGRDKEHAVDENGRRLHPSTGRFAFGGVEARVGDCARGLRRLAARGRVAARQRNQNAKDKNRA
jgi:hypothetical protein